MMRSALCPLVLVGAVPFSASPPVFPTCTTKCDDIGARVCMGQNRAWDRVRTRLPPSHLMERCEGLLLTSRTVVKFRFIPVEAYWMRLMWGKVDLIHSRDYSSVSKVDYWYLGHSGEANVRWKECWVLKGLSHITNDELEKFRLNFPKCTSCDLVPLERRVTWFGASWLSENDVNIFLAAPVQEYLLLNHLFLLWKNLTTWLGSKTTHFPRLILLSRLRVWFTNTLSIWVS